MNRIYEVEEGRPVWKLWAIQLVLIGHHRGQRPLGAFAAPQ